MPRYRRSPGFRDSHSPYDSYSRNPYDSDRHSRSSVQGRDRLRSICVSNIPMKTADKHVSNFLTKEFLRFGDFNISITTFGGERVAYVNFNKLCNVDEILKSVQGLVLDSKELLLKPIFFGYRGRSRSPTTQKHRDRHDSSSDHSDHLSRSNSPRIRDKFGDNFPARTLFIGNLSDDIDTELLRRKFEKYGDIQDIDVKRHGPRMSGAFAFLKYATLDMAIRAKHELDGEVIAGSSIKIGYGKAIPSNCVYISGLGSWLSYDQLEHEMTKHTAVNYIDWQKNKNYAFAIYDSVNDAVHAVAYLRNTHLGEDRRRIKVDYTEQSYYRYLRHQRHRHRSRRSRSRPPHPSPPHRSRISLDVAKNTEQLSECLRSVWTGKIVLRHQNFGCKLFKFRGDDSLVSDFMFAEKQKSFQSTPLVLKIGQRMLLDSSKLKEIKARIDSLKSREYCVMFATSYVLSTTLVDDALHPQKPIQLLIDYLRAKNSSGVVILKSNMSANPDVSQGNSALLIFPPCEFAFDMLSQKAPNLVDRHMMNDFLLIILMQHVIV